MVVNFIFGLCLSVVRQSRGLSSTQERAGPVFRGAAPAPGCRKARGRREKHRRRLWWAVETLQQDLLIHDDVRNGLWLAAPLPALYEPELLGRLYGWVWAPEDLSDSFQSQRPYLEPALPSPCQCEQLLLAGAHPRIAEIPC